MKNRYFPSEVMRGAKSSAGELTLAQLERETMRPTHDPETLETNVPGVYIAGSLTAGRFISEVFIENGRYDGEKIFGDRESRARAKELAARIARPIGE